MTNKPIKPALREPNVGVAAAIAKAGSQEVLADALGVRQPAIVKWLYRQIPPERAIQIEKILGIDRKLMRPDIFSK